MARVLTGERLEKELARLEAMKEFEREYDGCSLICGVDEAGRGPLAGPVTAGAVILPKDCTILYLNDSKKLSEKRREELFLEIREKAVSYSVGIVGPERIDEINILQATYEAMRQAVSGLGVVPDAGGGFKTFIRSGSSFKRRGYDPGAGDPSGSNYKRRREERIHRRRQYSREGDEGSSDGGI